jgi:TPR repeat protein
MKSLTRSLLLALALTTSSWVQAQSFEQALAASERGDYRTAFAGFKKLAEQGDAIAQFNLGLMYANGRGVPTDDRQAVAWYRKAAEKGIAKAQFNLGVMYDEGRGLPKDEQLALSWYRKAAEKGYADAQTMLGLMYANGLHVPKDEQQAVVWYRNAAEQGDAIAQFNLGLMHEDGDGVPKDEQQAVAWYRRAAEQGHASAQYNLGVRFYDGRGVPKDDQQAVAWFRKAADQGVAMAQTNLGKMYAKGSGVPKDEQMTYFWLLLASAQGDQDALKGRDIFERRLTTEQRAAAQAASRNWQPKATTQSSNGPIGSAAEAGTSASSANRPAPAAAQADATGSGFRVARGAIVTNHHVVDGCSRLRVNGAAAQVRSSDARSDLALLTVTLPGPSASLRAQRPAVGEPVAVAGFPLRGLLSGFNMTTGNLSSLSGMGGDTSYLQITAPVQPGNSGGPMLDSAGNLMGVVVSKLDAIKLAKITGDIPQNVNFAVHANVLRTFLDANSVDYDSASSEKPLATTAIAEKARGFTVLVECWK